MSFSGILPDFRLEDLIDDGYIKAGKNNIQPASIDLTLSDEIYEIPHSQLPVSIDKKIPVKDILYPNKIYICKLNESVRLSENLYIKCNTKSSLGRLDIFCRVFIPDHIFFDYVPNGYCGDLWVEIIPLSFPIKIYPGLAITQIRVIKHEIQSKEDVYIGLDPALMYESLSTSVCDLGKYTNIRNYFFTKTYSDILQPNKFYLIKSDKIIDIKDDECAEVLPYDAGLGEFRSHYAGFIDPMFNGYLVLETRCHSIPIKITNGMNICKIQIQKLSNPCKSGYGERYNHYQNQDLKMSKYIM